MCPGVLTRQALAAYLCTSLPEKQELFEPVREPGFWRAQAASSLTGPELILIIHTEPDHKAGLPEVSHGSQDFGREGRRNLYQLGQVGEL